MFKIRSGQIEGSVDNGSTPLRISSKEALLPGRNNAEMGSANSLQASVASLGGGVAGCHHFRVTLFCNTSQTEKKTTICLISLEMLSTLKLTKK